MTIDEYYAEVRRLGLRPSAIPHIYLSRTNDVHSVPDANYQSPEQRSETIVRLKFVMGISSAP
jgi:hypothetical protein